jgi:hypothetical protein
VRLVVQAGLADMDRRGVGEEFFLDGVTVEPATGHSLRSQRGKDPLPAGSGAPGQR